jgi:hypothetical protein
MLSRRFFVSSAAAFCFTAPAMLGQVAKDASAPSTPVKPLDPGAGMFVDITAKSGVNFLGKASHTPMKYLLETMGSGVALFDYDKDPAPRPRPKPGGGLYQKKTAPSTGTASITKRATGRLKM